MFNQVGLALELLLKPFDLTVLRREIVSGIDECVLEVRQCASQVGDLGFELGGIEGLIDAAASLASA
jgi:hypothetical protein